VDQNVFQQACLVQLTTSCWQGSRMLAPAVMEQIGSSEWLKGRKYLVNPEALNPIRAVISRSRKDLERNALPFPISGLTLVPKERIVVVDEILGRHQEDFRQEVQKFIEGYAEARDLARRNLAELFSELDYPVGIEVKFGFEWRYLALETPGKCQVLSPEIYEREKEKFQAMMEETRALAMAALRQEFADCVNHMVERLTNDPDGKPKVFKTCMVEKVLAFIDSFDTRNLFQDEGLSTLVEQARSVLQGVNPDSIRENTWLKRRIADEMGKVKAVLDQSITDVPRRKVRLAV
jgi:hypothetical protein